MSEWQIVELGDIADFSNGINFDKSAYTSGVPLIGVSNFGDRFSPPYDELDQVKVDIVRDGDYLQEGDIVFVRSNGNKELVGRCMLVRNCPRRVTYSGFCIRCRLRNHSEYDPVFFTYYFKSSLFRRAMSGTAVGANIQNLSQGRLSSHKAKIPDIVSQHYIADILSAYDSLIETNQRQIKLLEEAAQRLYREWFVDLRFPGHEEVPMVDGVPEGWKKGILEEIAQFRRGQMITKAQVHDGTVPVVAGGLEPSCYHDKANTVAPVITVSGSGANAGFTRLYNVDVFASDCSYVDRETTPYLYFAYCYLRENRSLLDSLQKGSAQPHVYAKDLNALSLIIPSVPMLQAFCYHAKPYFERIGVLQQEVGLSSQARDRLLSKLMSGEIAV